MAAASRPQCQALGVSQPSLAQESLGTKSLHQSLKEISLIPRFLPRSSRELCRLVETGPARPAQLWSLPMLLAFWKMFCMAEILSLSWMSKTWNCSGQGQRVTGSQAAPVSDILSDHPTCECPPGPSPWHVDHPSTPPPTALPHTMYP